MTCTEIAQVEIQNLFLCPLFFFFKYSSNYAGYNKNEVYLENSDYFSENEKYVFYPCQSLICLQLWALNKLVMLII